VDKIFNHDAQRIQLVLDFDPAYMGSAGVAFWSGVERAVCAHRHIIRKSLLYGLAGEDTFHRCPTFYFKFNF
jgi:hypothetical protein